MTYLVRVGLVLIVLSILSNLTLDGGFSFNSFVSYSLFTKNPTLTNSCPTYEHPTKTTVAPRASLLGIFSLSGGGAFSEKFRCTHYWVSFFWEEMKRCLGWRRDEVEMRGNDIRWVRIWCCRWVWVPLEYIPISDRSSNLRMNRHKWLSIRDLEKSDEYGRSGGERKWNFSSPAFNSWMHSNEIAHLNSSSKGVVVGPTHSMFVMWMDIV